METRFCCCKMIDPLRKYRHFFPLEKGHQLYLCVGDIMVMQTEEIRDEEGEQTVHLRILSGSCVSGVFIT